jgi:uncharacterized protein YqjF (DUF2071 family)
MKPSAAPRDPKKRPFLTARWEHLAMLNWEVPESLVQPYLPAGVEVDRFDGKCLASLVGLRFFDTKVFGFHFPFHTNFTEINLRFYVRRKASDGVRRGVVFVRELVPRFWIALIARVFYNEQYRCVPIGDEIRESNGCMSAAYRWKSGGRWSEFAARSTSDLHEMSEGTREFFIAEHYVGYTRQRDGSTLEYTLTHPAWRIWSSCEVDLSWDPALTYGPAWGSVLARKPDFAFIAEGSPVAVFPGVRI